MPVEPSRPWPRDPTVSRYGRGMRAFAHDVFTYPLPEGHRFPLAKYRLVREAAERLDGVDVLDADAAGWDELAGRTPATASSACARAGSSGARRCARPALVAGARRALAALHRGDDHGGAGRARGRRRGEPRRRHPPRLRRRGRGFCVFNDVVTALRDLRRRRPTSAACSSSTSTSTRATAPTPCSRRTPTAFTLSVNGFRNYPFRRVPGDLELDLPDGTGDDAVPRRARRRPPRGAPPRAARALLRARRRRPVRGRPARAARAHEGRAARARRARPGHARTPQECRSASRSPAATPRTSATRSRSTWGRCAFH